MRIRWLAKADRELERQLLYIAERNPSAATRKVETVQAAVERLIDQPHSGRPGGVPGTRELVVTGTPYVIAYRIEAHAVVVLRVMHGARRWPERI